MSRECRQGKSKQWITGYGRRSRGSLVGYRTSHDGDVIWSCHRIETPYSLCSVPGPAEHKNVSDFVSRYGEWALVAGASEGLGAAFAEQLAARGMNVLLVARREPELAELAKRLAKAYRVETRWLALDLADNERAGKIKAACESIPPGLLVYNAALIPAGPFVELEQDTLERLVRVNVLGPLTLLRYRLNGLRVFALCVALWFVLGYTGVLPWDWLWRHRWAGAGGAWVLGLAVAAWVVLSAPSRGGSLLAEYYLGRRKNPQMFNGRADAKMYLYVAGATLLQLNLLSFGAHHHMTHPGDLSPGVVLYVMLFTWFICDYLFFERVHL